MSAKAKNRYKSKPVEPAVAPAVQHDQEAEDVARKGLMILGVVIVALIVAAVVMMTKRRGEEAARSARAEAYATLDQVFIDETPTTPMDGDDARNKQVAERVEKLRAVITAKPDTNASRDAAYFIASSYYEIGEYEKAAEAFADFSTTHSAERPDLAAWATLGQANSLASQGKHAEALPLYQSLAAMDVTNDAADTVGPYARVFGAISALELGQTDVAKTLLTDALAASDLQNLSDTARTMLTRVELLGAAKVAEPAPVTPEAPAAPDEEDDEM